MKLDSVGPFTATPSPDDEVDLELEELLERRSAPAGIDDGQITEDELGDSTDQQAHHNQADIIDMLKLARKKLTKEAKDPEQKKRLNVVNAYCSLDDLEDELGAKGSRLAQAA